MHLYTGDQSPSSSGFWLNLNHTWHTFVDTRSGTRTSYHRQSSRNSLLAGTRSPLMRSQTHSESHTQPQPQAQPQQSQTRSQTNTRSPKASRDRQSIGTTSIQVPQTRSFISTASSRKRTAVQPITYFGESLEPADRSVGQEDGQLLVAIQTLQLFDSVFWPLSTDNTHLRNRHMLRYTSRSVLLQLLLLHYNYYYSNSVLHYTLNTCIICYTSILYIYCNIQYTYYYMSYRVFTDSYGQNYARAIDYPSTDIALPVFYHTFRLCLHVLSTLSPLHNMATLNVYRICALLRPMSSLHFGLESLPLSSILITSLTHMTINLQRLTHSLAFVYQRIGLAKDNPYNIGIQYTYI